jgi:hypothetical protein
MQNISVMPGMLCLTSRTSKSSKTLKIKSQALAEFIVKWTNSGLRGIDELPYHWVIYFDGSYTLKGAGASVVFITPEGYILKYAIQLDFPATNNIVEYERLVTGLQLA